MADAVPPRRRGSCLPRAAHAIRREFPRDDRDLQQLASGDAAAFTEFFECWFPRVLGYAQKRLSSNADARRVAEASLERVLLQLDQKPACTDFARWMLLVTRYELDLREP